MDKILIICGPTATGKTTLALSLAKKYEAELVSADSRQVYRHMNVGTGKDVPQGFRYMRSNIDVDANTIGYYSNNRTRIWGYDLVDPREEFSVSDYVSLMKPVLVDIISRKKLPIVVGGSGFYIKALLDGIDTMAVGKDPTLRLHLEKRPVEELFELLRVLDPMKSASLNISDKKNPRRLIRAIEVAKSNHIFSPLKTNEFDPLFIGLTMPKDFLGELIAQRVERRINDNFESELKALLKMNVLWSDQAMSSLGYKQWKDVLTGDINRQVAIESWIRDERKYAKRQNIWFKREKRINWFDSSDKSFQEKVENLVKKWHNQSYA